MIRYKVRRCTLIASDHPVLKRNFQLANTLSREWSDPLSDTTFLASDNPVTLCFSVFRFLTWIWFVPRFFLLPSDFLSFIAYLEQILSKCAWNLRPTQWMVKLLTCELLFIVRSQTRNYKTYTKSSVLHLLVTLESRKVLNLADLSPCRWKLILRGLLSFTT